MPLDLQTHHPFETPIHVIDLPGLERLNAELEQLVLAEAMREAGLVVSNRGGWHSRPDLARRVGTPFEPLCDELAAHLRAATLTQAESLGLELPPFRLALNAWAMVMGPGHYATPHDHAEATWSSAYYVQPGDPPPPNMPSSGLLAFIDPRRATPLSRGLELFPTTFEVTPKAGRLVIFPGYLQHFVHPYLGRRSRISIAANALVELSPKDRA
jgi:uncharacterized protein (TIGR02466 family)